MKSNRIYILITSLIILLALTAKAQESYEVGTDPDYKPKFNNDRGIFRVLGGGVKNFHDTIGGKVEFNNSKQIEFSIPNSVYSKLFIIGPIRKNIRYRMGHENNDIVVRDSLYIRDSVNYTNVNFQLQDIELDAKGNVVSDANMTGNRYVKLTRQDSIQSLESRDGSFDNLKINNPNGIDLVPGSKFTVRKYLELESGEIRNNDSSNFAMGDSAVIIRHPTGALKIPPMFAKNVSVYYVGDTSLSILSGPEIPKDPTVLQTLKVENDGGLYLDTTITANDTIYIVSFINTDKTDQDGNLIDSTLILISTSGRNPIFDQGSPYAEVRGNFRHTNLNKTLIDSLIFNNPYTWAQFESPVDLADISEMTFRVQPDRFPYYQNGYNKIKRYIVVTASDSSGNEIYDLNNMTLGYGWKNAQGVKTSPDYETNDKNIGDVILQRWDGSNWYEYKDEEAPRLNSDGTWAYGKTKNIGRLGFFAMGLPGDGIALTLKALVYLEGPYIGKRRMSTDLRDSNLIPLTPPDIYPYNLDPQRASIKVPEIPQGVVDWMLLEFRNNKDTLYRTCFLKNTGDLVDIDGKSPIALGQSTIDTGYYYISVRHRNHLDIQSLNEVHIERDTASLNAVKDFSDPAFVAGGFGEALKPIVTDGGYIYTMIAGESNNSVNKYGEIDYDNDVLGAWRNRNFRGKDGSKDDYNAYKTFLIFDYDMNGIITTKDMNISWNNRGRVSQIK